MDLGIDGRVALVTGASKGIGLGIARALAAEGVQVAITSRSRERIDAAAAEADAHGFVHDSQDLDGVSELLQEVESALGPLDILVTNTGGPPPGPDPLGFSREQWESAYRDLMLSPMAFIEAAMPGMRERGFGRVLGVFSSAVREPIGTLMLSNTHRSGLLAGFKTIARAVAADGVTVNAVLPGQILTDRLIKDGTREEAIEATKDDVPMQRPGTIEEFGTVIAFLASVPAAYVTGTAVLVDGRLTQSI